MCFPGVDKEEMQASPRSRGQYSVTAYSLVQILLKTFVTCEPFIVPPYCDSTIAFQTRVVAYQLYASANVESYSTKFIHDKQTSRCLCQMYRKFLPGISEI